MIIARKQALDVVLQALGFIRSSVENANGLHLYDLNVVSEHFFAMFLSAAYSKNFVDLNLNQQQPAIDIGDVGSGVCFQVTSDGKKQKIQETVDRYIKYDLVKFYPHLRVLIIGSRHGKYAGINVPTGVTFNPDNDVIGCVELAKHLNTLGTPDLQKLENIIYQEMPLFKQAKDVQRQTDEEALDEYRSYFDRPALLDPWDAERNYSDFDKALTDLIELMNTGWVDGMPVTKKRTKVGKSDWKDRLAKITGQLIALRQIFTIHVRSGEIDLDHNRCGFRDPQTPQILEGYKRSILLEMNSLLIMAGFPKIP